MAFYSPLPDGSFEVETDDGRRLRTAMDPSTLGFEAKPQAMQQFDAANTVAKNDDSANGGNGGMFGRAIRTAPENPVTDAIGQPGTKLVSEAPPAKPIAVQRSQQAPAPGAPQQFGQGNPQLDAMQNFVGSQIVKRSAPRKAGEVPSARTVQKAPTPSVEDMGKVDAAEQSAEQTAMDQRTNLVAQRNEQLEGELYRQQDNEVKLMEAGDRRQKIDAELMRLQQHAEKKEREAAEIKDLSPTDEFFKNSGGGWGRVLAGLTVILGGIGQGLSAAGGMNTQNQGMESIKRGIEETAQKQRAEYEQRKAAGQTARNAYSEALDTYGTPEAAMEALRLQGEAIAERKLAIMTEQYKGAEDLSNFQVLMAQNAAAREERRANLAAQRIGSVTQSYRYDPGSSGGASIDQKNLGTWLDIEKMRNQSGKDARALEVRLPDGSFVQAPSEQTAEKARNKVASSQNVVEQAQSIIHLARQPGSKTDQNRLGQIKTAVAQLQLNLKESGQMGSLDEGTQNKLNEITSDPTAIFQWQDAESKLKQVIANEKMGLENMKKYQLGYGTMSPSSMKSDE